MTSAVGAELPAPLTTSFLHPDLGLQHQMSGVVEKLLAEEP